MVPCVALNLFVTLKEEFELFPAWKVVQSTMYKVLLDNIHIHRKLSSRQTSLFQVLQTLDPAHAQYVQKVTADIFTVFSGKSTGVTNNINIRVSQ